METQWKATPCNYLRCAVREVQNQEQTLELRLTEGMPDIGRVLCAWGQPLLSQKQWRSEEISISGGITAWVLYIPEDGSQPRCVEGWIPFQAKWKLPQQCREGYIRSDIRLRSMDARAISSRKMLVRASLALLGEALEPCETEVYEPEEVQETVCLLRQTYPVQLVKEAGEKLFALEETLPLSGQQMERLLWCKLSPLLTEQAVTGSRMVLRGMLRARYLYLGEDGQLLSDEKEVPFAQFADLEGEYDKEASCAVSLSFAAAECTMEADTLRIKCELLAQYEIQDRCLLRLVEDAYSPRRTVTPSLSYPEIPVVLDRIRETLDAESSLQVQAQSVVDTQLLVDHPVHYREEDRLEVELPGQFQLLYYDPEGNLQSANVNWAGHWQMRSGENCGFAMAAQAIMEPSAIVMGDKLLLRCEVSLQVQTTAEQTMPMVTGLEVGEMLPADEARLSVILRPAMGMSLWELAKECGSTVEAIEQANGLAGQPAPEGMLLIPVV